jgi:hypothetical protein
MLISWLVSPPPCIPSWQGRFPTEDMSKSENARDDALCVYDVPVLSGNIPVARRTYPDVILPQRYDGHEEERKPHASGRANNAH